MNWERSRYGLPVIVYHWVVGVAGVLLVLFCTFRPPFPQQPITPAAFLLFFAMHAIASFLHFQYARLNVVITFESAFTTATLLVFGSIPAVWVAVIGIVFGSAKRVIERRFILQKNIPLSYDLGIIVFNSGMVGTMWLFASLVYLSFLNGELPLNQLSGRNIVSILLMFVSLSVVNHVILFVSSSLQGLDAMTFFKKGLVPAFLTEFATIPFGVVMALAYTRMGALAFFFLASTLLLSNAVLRNLSIIRYDQEEKLRQLTALNSVSKEIIALRNDDAIFQLLSEEITRVVETQTVFLGRWDETADRLYEHGREGPSDSVVMKMAEWVSETKQPKFFTNAIRQAPDEFRRGFAAEKIRSLILIPMMAGERLYGVLGVYSGEVSAFKREHMQVLHMIADEAALSLDNARLYTQLTDKLFELEHLNKELRQLDRLKSEFLANVSHELRTPLTSIKGYVEYIKKEKMGPITAMQNEGLSVAQRNILRLQRLIDDLLDYTRLEFKRTPLSLSAFTMEQLWHEVYDGYADQILGKKLTLHVTIPNDLPLLYADFQKMLNGMSNLISNAIKFTQEEGDIWIDVRQLATHPKFFNPDAYKNTGVIDSLIPVELSVRDNGVGIPEEAIPKIFERFYQVDSSNTRKYGGTGLGLAIVHSILRAHGMPIHVESKVGEGTKFVIVVPGVQQADVHPPVNQGAIEEQPRPKYLV